jgi:hypothetical protein
VKSFDEIEVMNWKNWAFFRTNEIIQKLSRNKFFKTNLKKRIMLSFQSIIEFQDFFLISRARVFFKSFFCMKKIEKKRSQNSCVTWFLCVFWRQMFMTFSYENREERFNDSFKFFLWIWNIFLKTFFFFIKK